MYFKELKLTNFKNCSSAELSLSEKINCFIGLNGAGKTNILDAVYYLAFCKSCFSSSDKLNIKHGETFLLFMANCKEMTKWWMLFLVSKRKILKSHLR